MSDDQEPEEPEAPAVPPEQEERIVDKVVAKVKEVIDEIAGSGRSDRGDGGTTHTTTAAAPPGPAATEADMERKVKEGVEKEITARERRTAAQRERADIAERLEKLEGKAGEVAPKTYSRLTTALWGGDDDS